jgi:hypothetical protein
VDAAVIAALIGAVVSILGAGLSVYAQFGLERFKVRQQADAIVAKYREPLLYAAFELQSRLYNIVQQHFLQVYYLSADESDREYALENTLYVIAQYFGWSEILRQDIQFLNLGEVEATRTLTQLQEKIGALFSTDAPQYGRTLRVFRGEQRAIGECMFISRGDRSFCRGYGSFVEERDESFRRWFVRLKKDIDAIAHGRMEEHDRLVAVQHALIALIDFLDPEYMRFSANRRQKIKI